MTLSDSLDPLSDPSEIKEPARARAPPPAEPLADTHWDAFWSAYPHPPGDPSKLAHEEWLTLSESGGNMPAIADAAKAYARGKRRSEWSVQAARWLREGRWSDWISTHTTIAAPAEPQIAANVSAADRAWLNDRWASLLREIGAANAVFVIKLVIVELGGDEVRLAAPTAFVRDYACERFGGALERAFGRRAVIDLVPPAPVHAQQKGKVA